MSAQVRVRYAPSPTGHLHIAGARTALYNYLLAKKSNGKFIVRFEDTDQARHVESGIDSQLAGLRWLGLEWDESVDVGGPFGPYRQMERLSLYVRYTEQLLAEGKAYRCYMNEQELEAERQEQEARGEMPKYSGKCRHLTPEQIAAYEAEGRKPAIRFRVPDEQLISFEDRVRGEVQFESAGIGDFVIVRPDGVPTYNYAVVLDDHLMDISHIIRGEEHLSNTPRQLMLYEAFGWTPPQFAHLSLILNADRKKMSKRDESVVQFVEQYRALGYLPEAVLNFIVLLGWSPGGEEEIFSKSQLIERFDLERVSKSPGVFDMDKLNWMSNQYVRKCDLGRLTELALPHLQRAGALPGQLDESDAAFAAGLVALYQEQMTCAADIVPFTALFFKDEVEYDEECQAVLAEERVNDVLAAFRNYATEAPEFAAAQIGAMLKQVQKATGCKGKQLFMPVRVALTGQTHGRDLNETVALLGREKTLHRLDSLLS